MSSRVSHCRDLVYVMCGLPMAERNFTILLRMLYSCSVTEFIYSLSCIGSTVMHVVLISTESQLLIVHTSYTVSYSHVRASCA